LDHKKLSVQSSFEKRVAFTRMKKEEDDAEKLFQRGVDLYIGRNGVKKNVVEAAKLLRKAAEKGHAEAQLLLGNCYFSGEGVKQDVVEAAKWWKKAAEQGLADAQGILGVCYEK
jgi:TPR repeat protein